jgi:serine/threonine-protein kinase RsbT
VSPSCAVEIHVGVHQDSDVAIARKRVFELASQQGLGEPAAAALATAVTEIARNLIAHAGGGEIVVSAALHAGRRGVIVTARDDGPGIADIDQAMEDWGAVCQARAGSSTSSRSSRSSVSARA